MFSKLKSSVQGFGCAAVIFLLTKSRAWSTIINFTEVELEVKLLIFLQLDLKLDSNEI